MSRRTERIASFIQQELAMIIMRELDDPRLTGLPSITRVKVSEDISVADVYVTVMGTEGKQTAALNALKHSAGMMRSRLAEMMELRQVPYLKFHIDENLKKEREVLDILRKIEQEREGNVQNPDEQAKGMSEQEGKDEG
jgi:ribosome-binding factor A